MFDFRPLVLLVVSGLAVCADSLAQAPPPLPEWRPMTDLPILISPPAEKVDFGPYMASIQKKIRSNWYPPKGEVTRAVTLQFKVISDGRIANPVVVGSSGSKEYDTVALAAVLQSSPLAPLPQGSPSDIDIEFHLDYNIAGKPANSSDGKNYPGGEQGLTGSGNHSQSNSADETAKTKQSPSSVSPRGLRISDLCAKILAAIDNEDWRTVLSGANSLEKLLEVDSFDNRIDVARFLQLYASRQVGDLADIQRLTKLLNNKTFSTGKVLKEESVSAEPDDFIFTGGNDGDIGGLSERVYETVKWTAVDKRCLEKARRELKSLKVSSQWY